MILTTITVAVTLAGGMVHHPSVKHPSVTRTITVQPPREAVVRHVELRPTANRLAIDLHPMTDEEKIAFPGRERFDKTEWYESQFKSAKIVVQPNHVAEWNNGGLDVS